MLTTVFYDARSYDRKSFGKGEGTYPVLWRFHDFRLSTETVSTARGTEAVCIFVNDRVDRPCIEDLSGQVLQDDELSRLLIFPNVLVTSHQAFLTQEALVEIARVTSENVVRFSEGRPFLEGTQL